MDRQDRRHQKDLEKHLSYEEMKLRKQARNIRRGTRKGKPKGEGKLTEENWEASLEQKRKGRRSSLTELIEELRPATGADTEGEGDAGDSAIVISVASGRCRVFRDGQEFDCLVPAEIAQRQKSALAVGDRVALEDVDGGWRMRSVLPRRTVLARPDPTNVHRMRVIAANIDVVVHVVSLKAPPLRPRLIDRFLIAIERGGAAPMICVNKIDLLESEERRIELAKLETYRQLGVPVIPVSATTGEGVAELRQAVKGKMCALVGHSGVGKSSILNALDASLGLATKTLHKGGTGRHTTSASTLHDLGEETYLIDTPGIREFGLWDLDRVTLRDSFPEFEEPAASCKFNDCSHVHEPDCEVKRLVEAGEMNRARYETYLRLYEDLEN